jgi:hypothetical protein
MNIKSYIINLQEDGITYTASLDIKNAILEYLKGNNTIYVCTMDDNFQYTIQLM